MSQFTELQADIRSKHPVTTTLELPFGDFGVRIGLNNDELRAHLERYFAGYLRTDVAPSSWMNIAALDVPRPDFGLDMTDWKREPGKRLKEAVHDFPDGRLLLKTRTGMQYLLGATEQLAFGPALKNANQVVNFVNAAYLNWALHRGGLLCHAAGLFLDEGNGATAGSKGLVIAAVSGGGKSTLMLQLMRDGGRYCSNDRVIIRPEGDTGIRMEGIPKWPRVNPGTLLNNPDLLDILPKARQEALASISRDELWDLEEKYDVTLDTVYGSGRVELNGPMDALLLLNWKHTSSAPTEFVEVKLGERPDLLKLVTKTVGPFYRPSEGEAPKGVQHVAPEPYVALLERVPVYEARGATDFELGKQFVRELAQG